MSNEAPVQAEYNVGDALFREGAAAHHIFIINSGRVEIRRRVFEAEVVLETLGKGNICGDIAFADGAAYPSSAVAIEPVEVVVVHRNNLQAVMLDNPKVVARMAARMAARLTHAHFRITTMAMPTALGRVMLQLRRESSRARAAEESAFAPIPYDLPEALGIEKGHADEVLRTLVSDSLIESDGASVFSTTRPSTDACDTSN
jgi:CRP-like cAMP-binding protein